MTNMISYLAEGSSSGAINPLLPTTYDIGWSIVVLLVVGLLFWKLVLPSFLKTLAEREELIKSGIENAEKAQNEAKAKSTTKSLPTPASKPPKSAKPPKKRASRLKPR